MSDELHTEDEQPKGEVRHLDLPEEELDTLSVSKRKLGLRIIPYNVVADSRYGPIVFEAGAFGTVDPAQVRLRMDHADPPTGLGTTFEEKADGAYMEFSVSRTQRGDEQLTLARDGVSRGASVGFRDIPGRTRVEKRDGRTVRVYGPNSAALEEVSTTWQPTFVEAGVMYALKKGEEGDGQMAEAQETTPAVGPSIDYHELGGAIGGALAQALKERDEAAEERAGASKIDVLLSKFDELADAQRAQFTVPAAENTRKPKLHDWVEYSLRKMRGEVMSQGELKELALDDVVTTEQPGLVPSVFTPDYDDLVNRDRPFLVSTRQIAPPRSGMSLTLPIITTRAAAGTQSGGEKTEVTTTATKVGTGTFAYQSVFGGADISIQMINRAESGFFELLTGDMAMAYALDCEEKALDALLTGYTDSASAAHAPDDGGSLDPENLELGQAWATSITAYKRAPDTIWLSTEAVAAFIDAKAGDGRAPLYSNLAAAFTAGAGVGGVLSGLRPIYVPALDATDVDVIVGPSRGFVWAEDPARELRADVPEKAGRDIALAGGIFPAPRFADAFTTYVLGGS